jgi:hypothetical protein
MLFEVVLQILFQKLRLLELLGGGFTPHFLGHLPVDLHRVADVRDVDVALKRVDLSALPVGIAVEHDDITLAVLEIYNLGNALVRFKPAPRLLDVVFSLRPENWVSSASIAGSTLR